MKKIFLISVYLWVSAYVFADIKVKMVTPQTEYAASCLSSVSGKDFKYVIELSKNKDLVPESFSISRKGKTITITGADGHGCIYGVNRLKEILTTADGCILDEPVSESPGMKIRGTCLGLQKTTYLPGHRVYEYPYTPENFPWFYDKRMWVRYLDMLAADNFNAVFLWNGHPFASLVKLKDYPFAPEVNEETMQRNQEMFTFITTEASRRGIMVIQMFYNIIVSKPFADYYKIKTQDRNRPITPLISDYTRKSIAAFIEKYPNVGLLICLGEAMAGIDTDIKWMTETIIPGIRDGLKASGRTDEPPIILRNHDTDGPKVLEAALPLYKNIYTMSKYTGESLTTYEPCGPWAQTHRQLAAAAPVHISNVHILANLEPWRWSSPAFVQKTIKAMHEVHHANGLHLYPQASYWDWPYSADKVQSTQGRLLQMDRDWMWYYVWGRYSWKQDAGIDDLRYKIAEYYGCDLSVADDIICAYDESGEIAPKLIRRFGITEGNRQTLLLSMKMTELVNPYKYTIYPGFYESCGPEGEKLIEYVEKEYKHLPHKGELPLSIIGECVKHGEKAVDAIQKVADKVTKHRDEFQRVVNDMLCYYNFAISFKFKVLAAEQVLKYKWDRSNLESLKAAVPLLEKSNESWKELVRLTKDTYLYANSMQTQQRRIPVGGDNGNFKTWAEMLPVYEEELENLRNHIQDLNKVSPTNIIKQNINNKPAVDALKNKIVTLDSSVSLVLLKKGVSLFESRPEIVDTVAAELDGLQTLVLNRDTARIKGITVEFTCKEPVQMLVGFFVEDQNKFAVPPKLEIDAGGNEYGQAEPVIRNAISLLKMAPVNIHSYHFSSGHHTINLPKGILLIAGFTTSNLQPRNANVCGDDAEVDWLFMN